MTTPNDTPHVTNDTHASDDGPPDAPRPPPTFPVGTVIEVSVIGVAPAGFYTALQGMAEEIEQLMGERFASIVGPQASVHTRWAEVRPATKEELLHFLPRKMHFTRTGDKHICSTAFVSKKNLTGNREEVTCKLCKRELGIT